MIDILFVAVAGRPRGKGIEMPFDPKKRMRFVAMLGEEATRKLELGLAAQGRLLEEQGVDWAELDACVGSACPQAAPPAAAAPTSPAGPYIAQLQPLVPPSVAAAQASLKASGSPAAQYVLQLLGE